MDLIYTAGGLLVVAALCAALYMMFGDNLRNRARSRAERRGQFGEEYDRLKDGHNNPFIPDFIEMHPGRSAFLAIVLLLLLVTATNCVHSVPPGHRGVLITLGKVTERDFGEGLQFKLPYIQKFVDMKVMLEKEMVEDEDAASSDLQEIKTTLTVHFNVVPGMAWDVYKNMRKDYHTLLLRPVIQEDLKATTALFTAEKLIKTRTQLVIRLTDKLRESLVNYSIHVQTVNFVNFQFSKSFSDSIEAKVTAEQSALEAKNKLEQIRHEAQQQVIQADAERNATVTRSLGKAQAAIIEAEATAEAIMLITEQMTPEYAQYLHLMQWDGKYPSTMLGSLDDLGVIIDTTP